MSADDFSKLFSAFVVLLAGLAMLLTLVWPMVYGLIDRRPRRAGRPLGTDYHDSRP